MQGPTLKCKTSASTTQVTLIFCIVATAQSQPELVRDQHHFHQASDLDNLDGCHCSECQPTLFVTRPIQKTKIRNAHASPITIPKL
jgi:hypothetical protein